MAERRQKPFDLKILDTIAEDLKLPSLALAPPRLEGFAYRFKLILPLPSAPDEEVFTYYHLGILFDLFEKRCGGSLASAAVAHPGWYGSHRPDPRAEPVKDYHNILKTAGFEEQEEILIERVPVWLVGAAELPRR